MSNSAEEVVIGANGRVSVGDLDSVTLPSDVSSSLGTGWAEVGFVSEDGVTFTNSQDLNDINAWQSFYPIRKTVTGKSSKMEFVMRQWNGDTVSLAFGGGEVDVDGGVATYAPPPPGDLDVRALCVEWEDGDATYRLVIPRGLASGEVSSKLVRTDAADLPISFEAIPDGLPESGEIGTNPWYLVTDAAAFVGS